MAPIGEQRSHPRKSFNQITFNDKHYYLLFDELDSHEEIGYRFWLSDGENSWQGRVDEDILSTNANNVDLDFTDYMNSTRSALREGSTKKGSSYILQIKEVGDNFKLMWKKKLPDRMIKFQLGEVLLKHQDKPTNTLKTILENSMLLFSKQNEQINHLTSENGRMASEREMALKQLEKAVQVKEDIENDLFTKFVAVLNSKKTKLIELRKQISDMEEAGPSCTTAPGLVHSAQVDGGAHVSHKTNSGSEEDEKTTDEEESTHISRSRQSKVKVPAKGQARKSDEPLLLLGEEENPTTAKRPRRRRTNEGMETKTPSKVVIPKGSKKPVKQTPKQSSTSKRPVRLKKTPSASSDKSRNNSEEDDLLDRL